MKTKPRIRVLITSGGMFFANKVGDVYLKHNGMFAFCGVIGDDGIFYDQGKPYMGQGLFTIFN